MQKERQLAQPGSGFSLPERRLPARDSQEYRPGQKY